MNTTTQPSIKSLLDETNRKQYGDMSLAELAPRTLGQELVFFKLDRYVSENELEKEYEERGLTPAGVDSLCVHDSTDLDTKKYVGTHWKDSKGKWCFAAFDLWGVEREVGVGRRDDRDWVDYWWFCGIKKEVFNKPQSINVPEHEQETVKNRVINNIESWKDCWNWKGTISKGYSVMKLHSRQVRVHRLIYELLVAPIPEDYVIDHVCRNKKCINPAHLQPVTHRENTLRGDGPTGRKAKEAANHKT